MHESEGLTFNRGIAVLLLVSAATVVAAWALGGATAGELDSHKYAPTRYDARADSSPSRIAEDELDAEILARDPVLKTLSMALSVPHYDLEHYACGRFLLQVAAGEALLREDDLDLQNARQLRRGPGWVMVEVPLLSGPLENTKTTARVRVVEEDGDWKLEHIRIAKRILAE